MTRPPAQPLEALRERLWGAVRLGDEEAAIDAVSGALDTGTDPESLLLDVIGSVQRSIGEEWAGARITVAQEHAATAINDRVVDTVARHPAARRPRSRGRVAVACVDGEWHALPARLLAEVLRLRGWHVDYLGTQLPATRLVAHVHRTGPDVVALSSSIATRLPAAHTAITACQAAGAPVLVGGAAFGHDGRYARLLGADAWAPDARAAAARLAAAPLTGPHPRHDTEANLPHLADHEYTLVVRSTPHLVRTVLARLDERFPERRDDDPARREATAESLSHLLRFLAAALYTDDGELFTGYLSWTTDILNARGVPARSQLPVLELLREQLKDFPRAAALLDEARTAARGGAAVRGDGRGGDGRDGDGRAGDG